MQHPVLEGEIALRHLPAPPVLPASPDNTGGADTSGADRLAPRRAGRTRTVLRLGVVAMILLALGNLAILGLTLGARAVAEPATVEGISGVRNLRTVDAQVLRGANPTHEGLEQLRDLGVTTVVDLRAEEGSDVDDAFIEELGMTVVHLAIRDGQTPSDEQMAAFTKLVADDPGLTFVHCGAGVGRTGVVAARYLVESGQASPLDAWTQNLAVGPPSIEQDAYALGIDLPPGMHQSMVAVSRFLDSPRRIMHYL
jgi:protein-tyrosine phosphatase